jgi:glycerol uptake facilitator-like aquaporin
LLLVLCAIGDPRNVGIPSHLGPLYAGLAVLNIGVCFGFNAGYAINPARDFSPRLFTLIAGWGTDTFVYEEELWFLVPIFGPFIGGALGTVCYSLLVLYSTKSP